MPGSLSYSASALVEGFARPPKNLPPGLADDQEMRGAVKPWLMDIKKALCSAAAPWILPRVPRLLWPAWEPSVTVGFSSRWKLPPPA